MPGGAGAGQPAAFCPTLKTQNPRIYAGVYCTYLPENRSTKLLHYYGITIKKNAGRQSPGRICKWTFAKLRRCHYRKTV